MTAGNPVRRQRLYMRGFLTLMALVAVSGCHHASVAASGGGSGFPTEHLLSTDSPRYAAGTAVTVQLVNRTGRPIAYDLCGSRLERRDGEGEWRLVLDSLGEVCTAELRTLRPRQVAAFTFKPQPRSRGEYRIRSYLEDLQARSRFEAVSNIFTIERSDSD